MAKVYSFAASTDWRRIVRAWMWTDGSQCLLAVVGNVLELRIERESVVLRRARYMDVQGALDAAQRWRIEYEIDCGSPDLIGAGERCLGCWETPLVEVDAESGIQWLRCPSCGNVWIAGGN